MIYQSSLWYIMINYITKMTLAARGKISSIIPQFYNPRFMNFPQPQWPPVPRRHPIGHIVPGHRRFPKDGQWQDMLRRYVQKWGVWPVYPQVIYQFATETINHCPGLFNDSPTKVARHPKANQSMGYGFRRYRDVHYNHLQPINLLSGNLI